MNQLLRSALIPLASGADLRLVASVLLWASTLAIVASVVYKFVHVQPDGRTGRTGETTPYR